VSFHIGCHLVTRMIEHGRSRAAIFIQPTWYVLGLFPCVLLPYCYPVIDPWC